jgi:HD-GYP domain-containing protein (c-di-GMP phosphodiesterase class II)
MTNGMMSLLNKLTLRQKPIRTRLLFGVAIVIIIIVIGTVVNALVIKMALTRSKDRDLENVFEHYLEKINNTTNEMIDNGISVALTGELLYQLYERQQTVIPVDVIERFLVNKVEKMPLIIGSGLWYEPYLFGGTKYFGPYAHWEKNRVRTTWEYNTQAYNYPAREWYTIAIPRDWDRSQKRDRPVYITRPYSDSLNGVPATFVTMSIPMYSTQGRIIGVSTTDWTIETIQKHLVFMKNFFYTPRSFLVLVSGVDGKVIFHTNERVIMSDFAVTPVARLLDIKTLPRESTRRIHNIEIDSELYDVLARRTDAGFLFFLAVPPKELYADVIGTMIVFSLISVLLIGIISLLIVRFIDSSIITRILRINTRITEIEKGDYTGSLVFADQDELSHIADNINRMSSTILNREKELIDLQRYLSNIVEQLRNALGETVRAIASIVETRDPYTAGHQRHVSELALAIATEMNLSNDQIEGLRISAVLHDIGKISIPAEILSKPGKLADIEFSLIKTHPQAGYDILNGIEFPWPVARTVMEHHERINGSGYPQNLKGDHIIIEARILAVADVVDAMASYRPYRAAMGINAALEEIENNKGILYDKDVADVCLKLFREKGYQLAKEEKITNPKKNMLSNGNSQFL